ncbi:hypothetical protein HDU76_001668 [Blyttiomyces sp. JEL0837]|nr:hypothetical protein HDU76_001668 [Blyttiomyces sp. JEL0837]
MIHNTFLSSDHHEYDNPTSTEPASSESISATDNQLRRYCPRRPWEDHQHQPSTSTTDNTTTKTTKRFPTLSSTSRQQNFKFCPPLPPPVSSTSTLSLEPSLSNDDYVTGFGNKPIPMHPTLTSGNLNFHQSNPTSFGLSLLESPLLKVNSREVNLQQQEFVLADSPKPIQQQQQQQFNASMSNLTNGMNCFELLNSTKTTTTPPPSLPPTTTSTMGLPNSRSIISTSITTSTSPTTTTLGSNKSSTNNIAASSTPNSATTSLSNLPNNSTNNLQSAISNTSNVNTCMSIKSNSTSTTSPYLPIHKNPQSVNVNWTRWPRAHFFDRFFEERAIATGGSGGSSGGNNSGKSKVGGIVRIDIVEVDRLKNLESAVPLDKMSSSSSVMSMAGIEFGGSDVGSGSGGNGGNGGRRGSGGKRKHSGELCNINGVTATNCSSAGTVNAIDDLPKVLTSDDTTIDDIEMDGILRAAGWKADARDSGIDVSADDIAFGTTTTSVELVSGLGGTNSKTAGSGVKTCSQDLYYGTRVVAAGSNIDDGQLVRDSGVAVIGNGGIDMPTSRKETTAASLPSIRTVATAITTRHDDAGVVEMVENSSSTLGVNNRVFMSTPLESKVSDPFPESCSYDNNKVFEEMMEGYPDDVASRTLICQMIEKLRTVTQVTRRILNDIEPSTSDMQLRANNITNIKTVDRQDPGHMIQFSGVGENRVNELSGKLEHVTGQSFIVLRELQKTVGELAAMKDLEMIRMKRNLVGGRQAVKTSNKRKLANAKNDNTNACGLVYSKMRKIGNGSVLKPSEKDGSQSTNIPGRDVQSATALNPSKANIAGDVPGTKVTHHQRRDSTVSSILGSSSTGSTIADRDAFDVGGHGGYSTAIISTVGIVDSFGKLEFSHADGKFGGELLSGGDYGLDGDGRSEKDDGVEGYERVNRMQSFSSIMSVSTIRGSDVVM